MQVVLLALIRSMPSVAGIVMFGLFEYIVFGILGLQLFMGKLYSCNSAVSCRRLHGSRQCGACHCAFVGHARDPSSRRLAALFSVPFFCICMMLHRQKGMQYSLRWSLRCTPSSQAHVSPLMQQIP